MSASGPQQSAAGWQRLENAVIAVSIVVALVAWGRMWWLPLATFVLFDLSALGYLISREAGALTYNLVHNYAPAALAATAWAGLEIAGLQAEWLALLAASWGFHVAVDRALGFGLKTGSFHDTHLGTFGRPAVPGRKEGSSSRRDPRALRVDERNGSAPDGAEDDGPAGSTASGKPLSPSDGRQG